MWTRVVRVIPGEGAPDYHWKRFWVCR